MINIYLTNGELDIYDNTDISITNVPMRFTDSFYKPFTNDFTIPKTHNNMMLLGCYSLVDFSGQLFGNELRPAILSINGKPMDIYIQFVSVNDDDITICVFENVMTDKIKDGNLNDFLTDDENTIFEWDMDTRNDYPNWFKSYRYGMVYDRHIAQLHPSKSLRDILIDVFQQLNVSMWAIPSKYQLIATKKNVTPQNHKQVVEGQMIDNRFYLSGGKHVTNDLEFVEGGDITEINFNRRCKMKATIWLSWEKRSIVTNDFYFSIVKGQTTRTMTIKSSTYTNHVDSMTFVFDIQQNDKIMFTLSDFSKYKMCDFVMEMEITDYEITDEDYSIDLEYVGRLPKLKVNDHTTDAYMDFYFDGSGQHSYTYNNQYSTGFFSLPRLSFCYFGYYTNLPKIKISDCLFSLQWILGKKLVWRDYAFNYVPTDNVCIIEDAIVTETRPNSTNMGQHNYIRFDGDDTKMSVVDIPNVWLEKEKDLHKSVFGYVIPNNRINQYTRKIDNDGKVSADYNEIDKPILMEVGYGTLAPMTRISLPTMGFENIHSIIEISFETFNTDVYDCDYCYIDGRKFMIVEVSKDFSTNKNNVVAILVPTN